MICSFCFGIIKGTILQKLTLINVVFVDFLLIIIKRIDFWTSKSAKEDITENNYMFKVNIYYAAKAIQQYQLK